MTRDGLAHMSGAGGLLAGVRSLFLETSPAGYLDLSHSANPPPTCFPSLCLHLAPRRPLPKQVPLPSPGQGKREGTTAATIATQGHCSFCNEGRAAGGAEVGGGRSVFAGQRCWGRDTH